jgi:putative transposase
MKYEDNSYYHVYNRGAHRAVIFPSDKHYELCRKLLIKYAEKYFVSISAYCLMPNHYHLILYQKPGGSISKCVQTTFNAYSQTINVQCEHSGTLFQGKAKTKYIGSDIYILDLIRYLHLNPVRANLVKRPENWPFSDYSEWIGEQLSGNNELRNNFFSNGDDYKLFVERYKEELDKQRIEKYMIV